MANVDLELTWLLEDDGTGEGILEIQNDPKFLRQILHAVDTKSDGKKRRTITRLDRVIRRVSQKWAGISPENRKDQWAEVDGVPTWRKAEVVQVSQEMFEFLYKDLVKEVPEGVQFRLLPVQELLVNIEDQYDRWDRERNKKEGEEDGKDDQTEKPEKPGNREGV